MLKRFNLRRSSILLFPIVILTLSIFLFQNCGPGFKALELKSNSSTGTKLSPTPVPSLAPSATPQPSTTPRPSATPSPVPPVTPTPTAKPSATPTATPISTPLPPTPTPVPPSPTPVPTPIPTPPPSTGTVNATSCQLAAVQSAINSAVDGNTVVIPAGNCTWANPITISKGIYVLGAGIGQTNITNGGFSMTTPSGKSWSVGEMTFSGTSGFEVASNSKSWRIHHIRFNHVSGFAENRVIWVQPTNGDYTAGVIDHCIFDDPQSIQVHYRGPNTDGGNSSFMRPLDLGGPDAVYIEDSQFNHTTLQVSNPTTDCEGGGRLVFRYNTVKNSYTEMHDAIIGSLRSCRKWETYNNTFEITYASGQCAYVGIRGGTGVVFNNTFKNATDCDPIRVALYRTYQEGEEPWNVLCSHNSGKACLGSSSTYPRNCTSDAQCGGVAGSCIAIDGASTNPDGYPCRDQFGFDGNVGQTSRPALFWNNKFANGTYSPPDISSGGSYIQQNRDYCVGTTTMPASCNGIPTNYTPYTYPHPLAQ